MAEIDKVIGNLEKLYCLDHYDECFDACGEDNKQAIRDAIALLNQLKPRVMTLDEVMAHYSLPPVFVDDLNAQEDYYEDIQPLYFDFPESDEEPWVVHWRGHAQVARYLNGWNDTYNKKWRCWTAKPSDEQRRGTPWK